MRKFLWSLGAIGALGFALTVSTAQDRNSGLTPTRTNNSNSRGYSYLGRDGEGAATPVVKAPADASELQKYSRNRSGTAATGSSIPPASASQPQGLKNYHKELFGAEAGAGSPTGAGTSSTGSAGRSGTRESVTSQKVNSSKLPTRDSQIQQTGGLLDDSDDGAIRQAGGLLTDDEDSGVQQADFAKEASKSEPIKQVSGSKAPKLPEFNEAAPASKSSLNLLPDSPPALGIRNPRTPAAATPAAAAAAPVVKGKPAAMPTSTKDATKKPVAGSPSVRQATGGVARNFTSESPRVVTEWKKLGDLNVGQPCAIELVVTNAGGAVASDVSVDAFFPESIRITEAKPEPSAAADHVTWTFRALGVGEERRVAMTIIPSQRGDLAVNANVRYTAAASTSFSVEEPLLKVAMSGPAQMTVGEPASQVVTVTNPGTGIAHNVTLEVLVPEGLEHARGSRLTMELGSLTPGEVRSVKLSLNAKIGGSQTLRVEAKAGSDLRQSATAKIEVLAPSLKLEVAGPALRYVGRDARYTINVKNDGAAQTNNVRTVYVVPKGFDFLHASNGGNYEASNRTVTWFLGSVDAGKTTELSVKLRPTDVGDFAHVAKVVSEHGATAEARTSTKIEGAASLVLEVVDLDDPVEVGRETAYEVRVRNDGSKEAQNVGLSIELPTAIQLIGVKAPVEYLAESGLLVFKSLPALPPGKTAIFHITVKGKDEGNQRLRARLTSDSIQEPLTVEELTKFYAD